MKAVRIHAFGDASVLRLEDIPMPVPINDDLLVRVMASAINPIEWKIRPVMMKQALGRDLPVHSDGPVRVGAQHGAANTVRTTTRRSCANTASRCPLSRI